MVPAGIKAEELAIRHVRQPGQRVPIARITDVESPAAGFEGQPRVDVGIADDVLVVIIIDKIAMEGRPIQGQRKQQQREADEQGQATVPVEVH